MHYAITLMILILCWVITVAISFVGGFFLSKAVKRMNKATKKENGIQEDENPQEKREYENFMNYRGVPQLGHKDYQ